MVTDINIADFDYNLPDDRIAKHPLPKRDACKLLVRDAMGDISDHCFSELPRLLPANAMLVYNNTKVINARLHFAKESGARIEVFCLEPVAPADYAQSFASRQSCRWKCFVGNSKRWKSGLIHRNLTVDGVDAVLTAERVAVDGKASIVNFSWDNETVTFSKIVEAIGEIPIPPYLNRGSEESDRSDYQTVFGRIEGSVAAPTAGLHFTPEVLEAVDRMGAIRREVTLHVGAGTFQPVQTPTIGEHMMHHELIDVDLNLIDEIAVTDRPIVAVGTTSVRTLETLYHLGCRAIAGEPVDCMPQWHPYRHVENWPSRSEALKALASCLRADGRSRLVSSTGIIIAPGYRYRVVDGIITNFHQPCSTLLLLISAFIGNDWRAMYNHALESDYRFLSYGDAMLLL